MPLAQSTGEVEKPALDFSLHKAEISEDVHVVVAPAKDCDQSQHSEAAVENDSVGCTTLLWILQEVNHELEAKDGAQG